MCVCVCVCGGGVGGRWKWREREGEKAREVRVSGGWCCCCFVEVEGSSRASERRPKTKKAFQQNQGGPRSGSNTAGADRICSVIDVAIRAARARANKLRKEALQEAPAPPATIGSRRRAIAVVRSGGRPAPDEKSRQVRAASTASLSLAFTYPPCPGSWP